MRSTLWQLVQLVRALRCSSVPGALVIHSRLVSCDARLRVFTSFRSRLAGASAVIETVLGPSRLYPVARVDRLQTPGSRRPPGKENSPLALLTTLTVRMPFLALTTTPSMAASFAAETLPASSACWARHCVTASAKPVDRSIVLKRMLVSLAPICSGCSSQ